MAVNCKGIPGLETKGSAEGDNSRPYLDNALSVTLMIGQYQQHSLRFSTFLDQFQRVMEKVKYGASSLDPQGASTPMCVSTLDWCPAQL